MPRCRRAWLLLRLPRRPLRLRLRRHSSRRSSRVPELLLRRRPLLPLRPRTRAACLGTVAPRLLQRLNLHLSPRPRKSLSLRRLRLSLRPRWLLSPLRLRLPRLPHRPRRRLRPSPITPPKLPPLPPPRPLRSRTLASSSANGPRLSSVSRRVRLPTQGFCSTPAPRPTTALSSRSRSPRARPLPSRCSVAPIRSRWSCRRSARSSVVAPSTTSWMEVARRLLNMRSILHLHGLRHLRTRNPCPRRPLHPRTSARRSQKRHR